MNKILLYIVEVFTIFQFLILNQKTGSRIYAICKAIVIKLEFNSDNCKHLFDYMNAIF